MRIALVCPYDWNAPGGVSDHVMNLAERLEDSDVRIFAPASEVIDDPGVETLGRPVPVRFNGSVAPVALSPAVLRRVPRSLGRWSPDLVHVHEPLAPLVGLAAAAWGPRPVIGTFHSWSDSDRLYRLAAPLGRRIARRLGVRIAVSPSAREYAAGALGLPADRFVIVPNGVHTARFATAAPFDHLRDPHRPLLLFVGRLERRKGLDVAVRAFLHVRKVHPTVRLVVVGDGPERRRCEELVPASAADAVTFTGRVDHADLARYHASADVFLAPARGGESFGVVLLEAMAAGLPVVASDIHGYRTVMTDGVQGRLADPADPDAHARAILAVMADHQQRTAMAGRAAETAARYDWDRIAQQVVAHYRAVLGHP